MENLLEGLMLPIAHDTDICDVRSKTDDFLMYFFGRETMVIDTNNNLGLTLILRSVTLPHEKSKQPQKIHSIKQEEISSIDMDPVLYDSIERQ